MNPAGPVENSENEFPTGPWTRTERAPTGSTSPHRRYSIKNENNQENGRRDVAEVAPDQAKGVAPYGRYLTWRRTTAVHREQRRPAIARNDIWSMDFVADELADGQRFRALTVIDLQLADLLE